MPSFLSATLPLPRRRMHILALTGSLRERSINTELLRAFERLAPQGTRVTHFDGLGSLPHFNPELRQLTFAVRNSSSAQT